MALSTGTIIRVGDASVDDYKTGHAYTQETKSPQYRLCGLSAADCVEEDQTSTRSQSSTILMLCTLVHAICKVCNIESGSLEMYCDNKEALRRKEEVPKSTFTTLSRRDVDVKMSVEYIIRTSPEDFHLNMYLDMRTMIQI